MKEYYDSPFNPYKYWVWDPVTQTAEWVYRETGKWSSTSRWRPTNLPSHMRAIVRVPAPRWAYGTEYQLPEGL